MSKTYCLLGDSSLDRNGESSKLTRVEYWYGIESTVEYTPEVSYALEREITEVAEASMSWCYQNGGRRVQEEETGGEYFVDASGRRLGITAMSSGPIDLPYSGGRIDSCPQELLNEDDHCIIMKGQMSLTSHASDDLSMSVAAIRTGIKNAMDKDLLLDGNNPDLATVTRVWYLGKSEENVLAYGVAQGGDFRGIQTSGGGDNNGFFVPVLATALVGTAIVALVLLFVRKRRRIMTQRQLDVGAAVAAASAASDDTSTASSMGDPAGSFHQGYYHYTRDGVRYLSPYCTTCRETERQLSSGHGLETISEDEQYFEGRNRLVTPDSKDLGGFHSGMDTHTCMSATCPCRDRERDVAFIPWLKSPSPSDITASDETRIVSNTRSSKRGRTMEV